MPSTEPLQDLAQTAVCLFGDVKHVRKVRHLINHGLPVIRIGGRIYTRESSVMAWVEGQDATPAAAE